MPELTLHELRKVESDLRAVFLTEMRLAIDDMRESERCKAILWDLMAAVRALVEAEVEARIDDEARRRAVIDSW